MIDYSIIMISWSFVVTSMANVVVVSSAHIMQHEKDIMKKVWLQNSQNPGHKDKCTDKQTCPVKLTMCSDLIVDRLSTESRNQPHSRKIFGHGTDHIRKFVPLQ